MKQGQFIAFEGTDGSGKSTQINLLAGCCKEKNIKYRYLHFPRSDSPVVGEMISRFLRGEFGDINAVNPYFAALMYAADRDNAKEIIEGWIKRDYMVIVDRYVYSNIAFQCAKFDSLEDKERLKKWINELEFEYNRIPKPDLSILLHVPFEFIEQKLVNKRTGADREYLKGSKDIHEKSLVFQKKVEREYLGLAEENKDFYLVDCFRKDGIILTVEEINLKIMNILKERMISLEYKLGGPVR